MARDHNADRIAAVCQSHCTNSFRISDFLCQLPVGPRFTERNIAKMLPDFFLEVSPFYVERNTKTCSLAIEVFPQFRLCLFESIAGAITEVFLFWTMLVLTHIEAAQDTACIYQREHANRGFHEKVRSSCLHIRLKESCQD